VACQTEPDWFNAVNYKTALLGKYIKDVLQKKGIDEQVKQICATSGTIANKVEFCHASITEIDNLDGFASYSMDLARRIHDFITAHNTL
jgi:hypothetical protein